MTTLFVLATTLQIVSSTPPLSAEQAAAVLRRCQCPSNHTNATPPIDPPPPSITIRSDSRSGPFGVLQLSPSRPTCCDLYIGAWPVMGPWPTVSSTHSPCTKSPRSHDSTPLPVSAEQHVRTGAVH